MKFKLFTAFIVGSLLLTASIAQASSGLTAKVEKLYRHLFSKKSDKNHVTLLFLQQAKSAEVESTPNAKGCYLLNLRNLNSDVIYFTDQPKRETGKITLKDFLTIWQHNEKDFGIRPNVALQATIHHKNTEQPVSFISTFSNPEYNAKTHALTYLACPINTTQKIPASKLENVTLFFDPFHPWPP